MKVFLCGIAGTGMSSLAGLFCQRGDTVLGSDVRFYPPVDGILKRMPVTLFEGFSADHIPDDVDLCVIGNVVSRGNPEAEHILNRDLPFCSMPEALHRFFLRDRRAVVVAGTHGKTTITSFLAHLLVSAERDPGFFVGGKPLDLETNHHLGGGTEFVIEGDEYETAFFDRSSKFLKYFPRYLILSSLEYDHVDFFPDEAQYLRAFTNLVNQVPSEGVIICHADHDMNRRAVEKAFCPVRTYGLDGGECRVRDVVVKPGGGQAFSLTGNLEGIPFETPLLGRFNLLNLAAGVLLGHHLGLGGDLLRAAVASFRGVERRLRPLNRCGKILFFEDFAHHPTSLGLTLAGLRENYPGHRLVAVFEPRSWSLRRRVFQSRLADSLAAADEVLIKDVYDKEKIPRAERLDVDLLREELEAMGRSVTVWSDDDRIRRYILALDTGMDQVVVLLSNGDMGGIPGFISELSTP